MADPTISLPSSTPGTAFTSFSSSTLSSPAPSPEVLYAQQSVEHIENGIRGLDVTFETLIGQIMHSGMVAGDAGVAAEIQEIRSRLEDQEKKHKDGLDEIDLIMKDFMEGEIIDQLQKQVEEEVNTDLDRLVKEETARALETLVPAQLQNNVQEKKAELERVRTKLHNSESRRANSLLRDRNLTEKLHTLYKADGTVSPLFPKTLQDLFALDAKTSHDLVREYDLPKPLDEDRDNNLNRFMVFCGVQYQKLQSRKGLIRSDSKTEKR
ncbi:hypothetical protein D9758_006756 [Tetrapyrgos nigripes]|uniref:Uncharacterized protein n=1 Tax=Tetrapyrgos nigripes TaxID=182062 RepID=A0A8H5CWL9_9AGAR|nr:hypothetical protein D9758_006756 [Tetrapyrgos nigripes]